MKQHSVLSKILIWLVFIVVSMGAAVGIYASQLVQKTLLADNKAHIHIQSDNKVRLIELMLDQSALFVKMLATQTRVAEYLQVPTETKKEELIDIFDRYQQENPQYLSIYLMDATGSAHISTDRSFVGNNYGFRPYFKEALKGKPTFDVAFGKTSKQLGYYFSHPVVDPDGKIWGVMVVKFDPSSSLSDLSDEHYKNNNDVMIINLQGIILYATDKDRELKSLGKLPPSFEAELKKYNPFQGADITPLWYDEVEAEIEIYSEQKTIEVYNKVNKKYELLTLNKIKNYPLYLVSENELDMILSQVKDTARMFGLGIFGAAVFCVIIASFTIRKLLAPIHVLKIHAERLEKSDFSQKVSIKTGDEFEELGLVLNRMQEGIHLQQSELERRVEERTAEVSSALKQMENQNSELSKGRIAILNVLEDERILEEELKAQKKGIEQKIITRTAQLNSEKTKLSASISSLPIGFIMVDKSHNILFVNNKMREILGLTKDHIKIFDDILNLFPKDSAIFKIHENYHIDKNFVEQTGEVIFGSKILKMSIVPITKKTNEETEVLGSIFLVDDITEEKLLERSKNEFFSIASHELRTPLTAIRGNTSMILDYYAKDLVNPDLITMITDTHSASIHLISIVNDFLDMSRLEQGKMEYKKEKVSFSEIVKKIMTALAVNALEKKIAILSTIDEKMVIWADYGKVEQVLFNLIGNALKFTDKGTITISAKSEKDNVQIEVSDTGRGIPLASQNLLFRKFQQAGSSTVTRDTTQGTGLGLYISRLMVEGMGGKLLLVKSIDGEGSVFSLTLPIGIKRLVLQ